MSVTRALALALLLAGCSKTSAADRRECKEEVEPYEPTPSEVPIRDDLRPAAAKRVGADNYKRELTRIERELEALEHIEGTDDDLRDLPSKRTTRR